MGSNVKDYLDTKRDQPFSWESNNCLSFVVDYLHECGFRDLCPSWFKGYKDGKSCYVAYRKTCRKMGYKDVVEGFDDLLWPEITLYPRDGFVVVRPGGDLIGYTCGVHYQGHNFFIAENGLIGVEPLPKDLYWSLM